MYRLVALCAVLGACIAQNNYNRDPQTAAILNEQRYLNGDGKFGAAYTQEDGVMFKEESDADGTRRGSYSYVDPDGQRRTVSYTAGKNGFQATGDHLPQAPAAAPQQAPQSGYQPQPQYNAPRALSPGAEDDGQYRPDQYDQGNNNNNYQQPQQQQYQQPQQQQQYQQPQQQYQPQQQQPQYRAPQQQYQPQQNYQQTTAAPHRFYPPGKLSLERSPDGFSYSFQKS